MWRLNRKWRVAIRKDGKSYGLFRWYGWSWFGVWREQGYIPRGLKQLDPIGMWMPAMNFNFKTIEEALVYLEKVEGGRQVNIKALVVSV